MPEEASFVDWISSKVDLRAIDVVVSGAKGLPDLEPMYEAVITGLKQRAGQLKVSGSRHYNPGWHYAIDLRAMLVVCEAIIRSALNREESRGGHTRLDFPETEDALENVNTVLRQQHERMICEYVRRPEVPEDLQKLL